MINAAINYIINFEKIKNLDFCSNLRFTFIFTDSVIFTTQSGEWEPETGDYLGQQTDEIDPKDGNYIASFVSGGCKNYSMKLDTGKVTTKVKGITLNHRNANLVNYDTLCRMVQNLNSDEPPLSVTVHEPRKITRDVKRKRIETKASKKDYRVVFDKRRIIDNFNTLPFGYGPI